MGRGIALALLCGLGLILSGCAGLGGGSDSATRDGYTAGGPPPPAACQIGHMLKGQPYCLPVAEKPRPLYCFHSLGSVDCYATPDPFGINASDRVLEPAMVADPGPHGPLHLPEVPGTPNPPPGERSLPTPPTGPFRPDAPVVIAPLPPSS